MSEVPSESTATALLPQLPCSMSPTCFPRHAALLGAEPTVPTLLRRTRKRHRQEAGTHSSSRLVSADSQLGTLPCSLFKLRSLHTRSGLGRSAVLRRIHSIHVPLPYPRTVPITRGAPWVLLSHRACPRTALSTATALLPSRRARCPIHASPGIAAHSEQCRPIRPSSAARANAIGKKRTHTVLQDW